MSKQAAKHRPDATARLTRGGARLLAHMGFEPALEFRLPGGRRADLAGIDRKGRVVVVEVKSSLDDFRADGKWPDYLEYCDLFYFLVGDDFPTDRLPPDQGLMIGDGFGAQVVRPARESPISGARRKALLIRFARTVARRLQGVVDPGV